MSPDQLRLAAVYGSCKEVFDRHPRESLPEAFTPEELEEFVHRSIQFFWTAEDVQWMDMPPLASQLAAEHMNEAADHLEGTL